ncbi:glycosyltransferase family 2 protein [Robbsia sp. KACC 23696]|uniref:glycosyltransferase family 2 protein n=1 Tax=Robbsia sp. KACC 23696 TaxID=3149231 RepID=UPI00325ACD2A
MQKPSISPTPNGTPTTRSTLGVALITRNAAQHLAACLDAVRFADEIVLLDQSSTDGTVALAEMRGARVVTAADWPGFGPQKNRAIALLETDWILVLDADEVVSETLAASLVRQCQRASTDQVVYALDRVSSFCGHWIQHSGWRPDIIPRVFRRGTARFSDDRVHERLLYDTPVQTLDGELLHYSYDNVDTVLRKIDQYAAEGARQRFERAPHARPPTVAKAWWRAVWAFFRTFVLKRGFLDGGAGLSIAAMNAQTVFYRFLRLRERLVAPSSTRREDGASSSTSASITSTLSPDRSNTTAD